MADDTQNEMVRAMGADIYCEHCGIRQASPFAPEKEMKPRVRVKARRELIVTLGEGCPRHEAYLKQVFQIKGTIFDVLPFGEPKIDYSRYRVIYG